MFKNAEKIENKSTLIIRAKIIYIYILYWYIFTFFYLENGSSDFEETKSINKF